MTAAVTVFEQKKSIRAFLDKPQVSSQLIDVHPQFSRFDDKKKATEVERLKQIALVQIDKNDKIGKCDPFTIYTSLRDAAKLGLLPDSTTQEGHLVPFYSSKNKRYECQFMVGYKGLIKLALRSGYLSGVEVRAVHANDHFEFGYGLTPYCDHRPSMGLRGAFIGAYGVVVMQDGRRTFEFVSEAEGLSHGEKFSKSKNKDGESFGPWKTDPIAMIMKTALRKAMKYVPLSGELDLAVHIDDQQESGFFPDKPDIAEPEETTDTTQGENHEESEAQQPEGEQPEGEQQGAPQPEKVNQGSGSEGGQTPPTEATPKRTDDPGAGGETLPKGVCQDIMNHAEEGGLERGVYMKVLTGLGIGSPMDIPSKKIQSVMDAVKKEIENRTAAK